MQWTRSRADLAAIMELRYSLFRLTSRFCRIAALAVFLVGGMASVALAQGSVAELDRDNGLPDAPMGTPLKAMGGLKEIENTGRWLSYVRPGDKLEFLGIPVKEITYNFFKEKLYSINLDITGKRETKRMLRTLEARYGKDHTLDTRSYAKVTAEMEIREWKGAKMYCVYKSSSEFDGGVLTLLDRPTWDQLQIPKKEKAKESEAMLKGSFTNGDF